MINKSKLSILLILTNVISNNLYCSEQRSRETKYLKAAKRLETTFNQFNTHSMEAFKELPSEKRKILFINFFKTYCEAKKIRNDTSSNEDEKRDITVLNFIIDTISEESSGVAKELPC